jgi:hypothetical protein
MLIRMVRGLQVIYSPLVLALLLRTVSWTQLIAMTFLLKKPLNSEDALFFTPLTVTLIPVVLSIFILSVKMAGLSSATRTSTIFTSNINHNIQTFIKTHCLPRLLYTQQRSINRFNRKVVFIPSAIRFAHHPSGT